MTPSYAERPRQSRPFICTPYVAAPDGRLAAKIPDRCPARVCGPRTTIDCEIHPDHHRQRKTGPAHPLAVVRCHTHGVAFTLYPPGYAPYRRQSVLNLSYDGSSMIREKGCDQERSDERTNERTDFEGTLFESALDARRGVAWARRSSLVDVPDRYWAGQGRHLRLAARITGVARDLSERVRVLIAMILSVDCLGLKEGARAIGYRAIGKAVCSVLAKLKGRAYRARTLLICGAVVGRWGEPLHWDPKRRVLERTPFPIRGTGAAP